MITKTYVNIDPKRLIAPCWGLVVAHLTAWLLDFLHLADFRPIPITLIGKVADSDLWNVAHIGTALALAFALVIYEKRRFMVPALISSSAVMTAWSTAMLGWGFVVDVNVSLLGPVFGLVFGFMGFALAGAWAKHEVL